MPILGQMGITLLGRYQQRSRTLSFGQTTCSRIRFRTPRLVLVSASEENAVVVGNDEGCDLLAGFVLHDTEEGSTNATDKAVMTCRML